MANKYYNWSVRRARVNELEEFMDLLAKKLGKNLDKVDATDLILDHKDAVSDTLAEEEQLNEHAKQAQGALA